MDEERKIYITKEGLERIKKEYEHLKNLRLAKTKNEVPKILESEDLNPDYISFQEDLSLLETKTAELENVLKNAELIKTPPKSKQNVINLGATVSVELDGEIDEFKIVGTLEADPSKGKVSNESPLGKNLLSRKAGDICTIKAGFVNHDCKIVRIKYNKI